MFFDQKHIEAIASQAAAIQEFCEQLNKDSGFVSRINALVHTSAVGEFNLKAQQFFVSDLILAYSKAENKETEKSRFTLAFYYDALRNQKFADPKDTARLNQLVAMPDFMNHLAAIRQKNSIASAKPNAFFVLEALSDQPEKANKVLDWIGHFLNNKKKGSQHAK